MLKSKKKPKKKQSEPKLSHKERLAKKRQVREGRQKLMGTVGVGLFLGAAIGLPLAFAVDLKIGLGIAALIPTLLFSFQYPRPALWFFLIYMPFSGTIVYSVGGGSIALQLVMDAFYLPAFVALLIECQRKNKPVFVVKQLVPTLAILVFVCLMTLFIVNVSQQMLPFCSDLPQRYLPRPEGGPPILIPCKDGIPFLQGILGLRVVIGYIPLIFCAYHLIEDKKRLLFLGRLLLVLALICCTLGLVQYWMLETGRCAGTRGAAGIDLFKASLDARCFVGGSLLYSPEQGEVRLPGTFVSPWHWAWFLVANGVICYATAFGDSSFRWRMAGLAGMALVFVNAVISGQRLALALVPALIILSLFLTGQIANLKRFIPVGVGLAIILGVAIAHNPDIVQNRVDSFVSRWNASPPHLFVQQQLDYAAENLQGFLGNGLGRGTNSTRVFGGVALIETFHAKLLYEIGYVGLFVFLLFVTHLTIVAWIKSRSIRDPVLSSYGSSFWVFVLVISFFPYWYPLDTVPVSVYYWFLAGVIFKLPIIDKQEQEQKIAQVNRAKPGRGVKTFKRRAAYRSS